MFGIDVLHEEHENIRKFTQYLRRICGELLEGKKLEIDTFAACVDFMKNYADIHHHGKEEVILFKIMVENLGPVAEKMVNIGMMTEHNLGKYHIEALEKAVEAFEEEGTTDRKVDIVTHCLAYADLLLRHLEKENNVLYPFAIRNLKPELMEKVNEESKAFEENGAKNGMGRYVEWLNSVCR